MRTFELYSIPFEIVWTSGVYLQISFFLMNSSTSNYKRYPYQGVYCSITWLRLIVLHFFKINYFFLNLQNDWGKTVIDYNYHELVLRWVNVLWHFLLVCHLVKTNQSKKQFGYWFSSPCQLKLHVSRRKKIIVHRKHFLLTYKKWWCNWN